MKIIPHEYNSWFIGIYPSIFCKFNPTIYIHIISFSIIISKHTTELIFDSIMLVGIQIKWKLVRINFAKSFFFASIVQAVRVCVCVCERKVSERELWVTQGNARECVQEPKTLTSKQQKFLVKILCEQAKKKKKLEIN